MTFSGLFYWFIHYLIIYDEIIFFVEIFRFFLKLKFLEDFNTFVEDLQDFGEILKKFVEIQKICRLKEK